jgi:hypothetical protein
MTDTVVDVLVQIAGKDCLRRRNSLTTMQPTLAATTATVTAHGRCVPKLMTATTTAAASSHARMLGVNATRSSSVSAGAWGSTRRMRTADAANEISPPLASRGERARNECLRDSSSSRAYARSHDRPGRRTHPLTARRHDVRPIGQRIHIYVESASSTHCKRARLE